MAHPPGPYTSELGRPLETVADMRAVSALGAITVELLYLQGYPNLLELEFTRHPGDEVTEFWVPPDQSPHFQAERTENGVYAVRANLPKPRLAVARNMNAVHYEVTPPPQGQFGAFTRVHNTHRTFQDPPPYMAKQLLPSAAISDVSDALRALIAHKPMNGSYSWRAE